MKRVWLPVLVVLLTAPIVVAQTSPQVTWVEPNVSATLAGSYTYRLYTTPAGSTTPGPAVVLATVVCTGVSPTVTCSAPLGPAAATAALQVGAKSTLSVQDVVNGSGEVMSGPFTPDPSAPTQLKIK